MVSTITELPTTSRIVQIIDRTEDTLLCLLLLAMIILACSQIALRTFFSSGILWADPLLRYLVLWSGLLGAVTATGKGKHIALDILGGRLPKTVLPYVTIITYLFCCCASAGLTWASWLFLAGEIEFGGAGPLAIPLWFWNSVFLIAFGLITIKYMTLLSLQIKAIFKGNEPLRESGTRV
ncbi:MAG: TRAP transporter small permease [Desulfobulbaceae bacterium]|nr:TRAP transporter small permease [Desulfobulbaceae bacterium]